MAKPPGLSSFALGLGTTMMVHYRRALLLTFLLSLLFTARIHAHPVPRSSHDRTIMVRISSDAAAGRIVVLVKYRLEVDELTVVLDDMADFREQVDFSKYRNKPAAFYSEFTRLYAPILAANLLGKADAKELTFECIERSERLRDEEDRPLGHLRCDFVFRATFSTKPDERHRFQFREGNYLLQAGKIDLSLMVEPPLQSELTIAPPEDLKKRPEADLRPGDEEQLRRAAATFTAPEDTGPAIEIVQPPASPTPAASTPPPAPSPEPPANAAPPQDSEPETHLSPFRVFMEWEGSFWVLLLVMAGIGAAHALTPGHGKTLVAAYLVGENGTTAHALVLGLVTTLTHTAAVLAIALLLLLVPAHLKEETRSGLQTGLQFGMGLLVALTGAWLLLTRLAGRADHIHLGGHGHHHHHHHEHSHADHDHDAHGNVVPRAGQAVGWWGLIVMGMTGGIVPCWDAMGVLTVAVASGEFWMGPLLVLSFSAGLAAVLVLIGILVVHARNFARSRWGEGPLVRALPLLSAVVVIGMGLWLCYDGVQAQTTAERPAAAARP